MLPCNVVLKTDESILFLALKCEIPEFDSAYFAGYPKPAWVKRNEQLIFRCNEKYYDRPTYSTCAGENLWEKPFPPCQCKSFK